MTITAKIVADSTFGAGRITTMLLRYPRFIHAEFMTHRVFSRNASSSRAIPVKRLIEDIQQDPVTPSYWGKNKPGMQAREELEGKALAYVQGFWDDARDDAIKWAKELDAQGAHKQIVNRVLEPFSHINVVVTATDWDNFFALRRHPDAQPEIKALADVMFGAMVCSEPKKTSIHLPFISIEEFTSPPAQVALASAARCARTSFLTHDLKDPDWDKDLELANKLIGSEPKHYSPFEHQARCIGGGDGQYANFSGGWRSFRYAHERELNF